MFIKEESVLTRIQILHITCYHFTILFTPLTHISTWNSCFFPSTVIKEMKQYEIVHRKMTGSLIFFQEGRYFNVFLQIG